MTLFLLLLGLTMVTAQVLPGGFTDLEVNDEKATEAAAAAVSTLAGVTGGSNPVSPCGKNMDLVGVEKAESQVVAGTKYKLTIRLATHTGDDCNTRVEKVCKVAVWEKLPFMCPGDKPCHELVQQENIECTEALDYTTRELKQIIDEKEAIIKHKDATITNLEATIQRNEAEIQRKEAIIQNQLNCPVDGKWSSFSEFGQCSATCGQGIRERTRTCSNPPPQHGGQHCQGLSKETENCVLVDNCPPVIFITGGTGTYTSEVLDPAGSCSRINSPLPDRRTFHSMSRMGDDVVVCGGLFTLTSCISTQSPDGPWVNHSTLTTDRSSHASVATGDTIHVFGGVPGRSADTLENGSKRWKKHQLPDYIGRGPCAVEINNTVYMTGGADAFGQTWKWDTDQQWTRLADMDSPERHFHGCVGITVAGKSLLLVAGGYDRSNYLRTSVIYDIEDNTWTSTGELNQVRNAGDMVNLDGDVYMLGGHDAEWNILNTVEKFNVATNEWVTTNLTMKEGRFHFKAVSVNRVDFC